MNRSIRQAVQDDINYECDHRVRAQRDRRKVSENWDKLTITYHGLGDDEEDLVFPAKVVVCNICNGRGHHVNPSVDAGGLSAEDFAEDPDFAGEYMSGTYDVTCYGCGGRNVVLEVDDERADKASLARLQEHFKDQADMRAEQMAERRMGA